jgi:hypothetical protein
MVADTHGDIESITLEVRFAGISPERRTELDGLCHPDLTQAEMDEDTRRWEERFDEESKGLKPEAADVLWYAMFTNALESVPCADGVAAPQSPKTGLEQEYVEWRKDMLEWKKREELGQARVKAEAACAAQAQTIREEAERRAAIQRVMASSVRTALELMEPTIRGDASEECLARLNDEELLFFLLLTGYRVSKKNVRKPLSMREICRVLGLGSTPHPQTVKRKRDGLVAAHPGIQRLIAAFRVVNQKGVRRDKHKEISTDDMGKSRRREMGLDDA